MTNQEKSNLPQSSRPVTHRAPWLIAPLSTGSRESFCTIIEDGALLVGDGLIQAVGKYNHIAREYGQYHTREHEGRVLAPALINGHCHLELSHLDLATTIEAQSRNMGDPTAWIRNLLAARERVFQDTPDAEEVILSHARQTLQQMSAEGVVFVGDVGNSLTGRFIGDGQRARVCFLLELLGLTRESEAKTFTRLEKITADTSLDIGCTPHAPYSTTPALIQAIKRQASRQGHIFSIHVAESRQEVEFLQYGTGVFREFLLERGAWDGSFTIPGSGAVHYLENLGVLDKTTLCVHGVYVDQAEIEILARKKAKICLCPGSNRYLGSGKAPVTEFLAHGILPALGTDSKASNEVLSIWREMRLLREDHPGLLPDSVFAMATLGGAEAWGLASEIGSLEPGKQAQVLAVGCEERIDTASDVFEYLTTADESVQTEWLVETEDAD